MLQVMAEDTVDILVIGAGPTGLACAIEAQRAGLSALCVDKGCLANSLFHYPANMTFFTTPELLEIGEHTVQNAVFEGELPAQIVDHDIISIRRDDVVAWFHLRYGSS